MSAKNLSIDEAAINLQDECLVVIPTETVYGLAGLATSDIAIAKIYHAKRRPNFNPLIIHVLDVQQADRYVYLNEDAKALADKLWPGPLTLILEKKPEAGLSPLLSCGLTTVGVRCPQHQKTLDLIKKVGIPIAAPSANLSTQLSPTSVDQLNPDLINLTSGFIDGGSCEIGIESTILDLTEEVPTILRPGAISQQDIEKIIDKPIKSFSGHVDENIPHKSPGLQKKHYAPDIPIRLNALSKNSGEAFLAFGQTPQEIGCDLNLSETGNLLEAASNLFRYLFLLDKPHYTGIAVMPIPQHDLGIAINDRLIRAASKD